MEAIPMHRMALVLPFSSFLKDIGAPVERGLRQAGLPILALDDVNHYVPTQRFWSCAAQMALQEGIEDLGFRVGQKYGANCADPKSSVLLNRSPTLYHAMETTSPL